jgi:hypothetical protein
MLPKLFGPLRERYAERPGGYTRVLRVEPSQKIQYFSVKKGSKAAPPERKPQPQAPMAILELVDGPKDMRFAMTARTLARERSKGRDVPHGLTRLNVQKVTQFRKDGVEVLERAISKLSLGRKEKKAEKEDQVE